MIKKYQHIKEQNDQMKVLFYLIIVLAVFVQQQPYQDLHQDISGHEELTSSIEEPLSQSALADAPGKPQHSPTKVPFSAGHFQLSTASGSSFCLSFENQFRQAYKTAQSAYLALKPDLIKRWQLENLSFSHRQDVIV